MTLLTQNSKLKKTSLINSLRVYDFGITAGLTCPEAGECAKFCYAKKGFYSFGNVKPAFKRRYKATLQDNFCEAIWEDIVTSGVDVIRIHSSGDFYNNEYLSKWMKVIVSLPHVRFYAYTKSVQMIKKITLPDNLTIIYSLGGKEDHLIDVKKDRHSRIFSSLDEIKKSGYANASDNDLIALGNNKKIGLIIH